MKEFWSIYFIDLTNDFYWVLHKQFYYFDSYLHNIFVISLVLVLSLSLFNKWINLMFIPVIFEEFNFLFTRKSSSVFLNLDAYLVSHFFLIHFVIKTKKIQPPKCVTSMFVIRSELKDFQNSNTSLLINYWLFSVTLFDSYLCSFSLFWNYLIEKYDDLQRKRL